MPDLDKSTISDVADLPGLKRRSFPHALGLALLPDERTRQKVLSLTNLAFGSLRPQHGIKLGAAQVPHVSLFQNMFHDPADFANLVNRALQIHPIQCQYSVQNPPRDIFIWAQSRPFISHEVTAELACFHDYLLVECIINGRDRVCAACPADSKPLQDLSKEEQRAYCETGYVFAGAGSELANEAGVPWRAFTIPHFTLGVIDWTSRPHGESIESTQSRIVSQLRTRMKELSFDKCRFEKLVIFRVQTGGAYVPTADNTLVEYVLG